MKIHFQCEVHGEATGMEEQGVLGSSLPSLQPGSGLSHNFFFFLIENGFFSHKMHTDHSFLRETITNHGKTRQKKTEQKPLY